MTSIDDRLRQDLPELADALLDRNAGSHSSPTWRTDNTGVNDSDLDPLPLHPLPEPRRRPQRWIPVAAAVLALIGAVAVTAVVSTDEPAERAVTSWTSDGWGTWHAMSDAPVQHRRTYPVAAWTGDDMIVWGGTNLERNWAHSGGGAYDPDSDTWQELAGPSWGHPGLAGVYFDGQLWLVAKGGGSRFAPGASDSTDLPRIDGMFLAAIVATDDDLWVLGPAGPDPITSDDLGIARFDPDNDRWELGPSLPAGPGRSVDTVNMYDNPPVWTGTHIVVWHPDGHGAAFDPVEETWHELPDMNPPAGGDLTSTIATTDDGLAAIARTTQGATSTTWLATLTDDGWTWHDMDLATLDLERTSVVGAGEWMMLFRPDETPIAIHTTTQRSHSFDNGPLAGLEAPGTVWTGHQLLVWGGMPTPTDQVPAPAMGAVWTPPAQ